MQKQVPNRQTSGAKAIAIDQKAIMARYRLYMLISIILSAAFALGLHFIFGL
jgi:hypothetical protein